MIRDLLSIDLNTIRLTSKLYDNILYNIDINNTDIHIYNYIKNKHEILNFTHNEHIHLYSGSRKKVALDLTQALDIAEQCATNHYNQVFILCGEYESEMLFNKLTDMNINYIKLNVNDFRTILSSENYTVNNLTNQTSNNLLAKTNDTDSVNSKNIIDNTKDVKNNNTIFQNKNKSSHLSKEQEEQIKLILEYVKRKKNSTSANIHNM